MSYESAARPKAVAAAPVRDASTWADDVHGAGLEKAEASRRTTGRLLSEQAGHPMTGDRTRSAPVRRIGSFRRLSPGVPETMMIAARLQTKLVH
jgi:hypothetical protein